MQPFNAFKKNYADFVSIATLSCINTTDTWSRKGNRTYAATKKFATCFVNKSYRSCDVDRKRFATSHVRWTFVNRPPGSISDPRPTLWWWWWWWRWTAVADAAPTWTQLYQRLTELEAEVAIRASESRDTAARLERELSRATKSETELRKQLQTVELKLKRTERMLITPGQ